MCDDETGNFGFYIKYIHCLTRLMHKSSIVLYRPYCSLETDSTWIVLGMPWAKFRWSSRRQVVWFYLPASMTEIYVEINIYAMWWHPCEDKWLFFLSVSFTCEWYFRCCSLLCAILARILVMYKHKNMWYGKTDERNSIEKNVMEFGPSRIECYLFLNIAQWLLLRNNISCTSAHF